MNWTRINPNDIDMSVASNKSLALELSMSPYDIPQFVGGSYCQKRKKFIIEFKYLTEEPTIEKPLTDHVISVVGKNSGRLYGLLLDLAELGVSTISLKLKPMLSEAMSSVLKDESQGITRPQINRRILDKLSNVYLDRLQPA